MAALSIEFVAGMDKDEIVAAIKAESEGSMKGVLSWTADEVCKNPAKMRQSS